MATFTNTAKAAAMNGYRGAAGSGSLEIQTTGGVALAVFNISASGGSVTDDVWTLAFDATSVTAAGTGTAAQAVIKDDAGADLITGITVGTTGTDIIVDNVSIASGQTVNLSGAQRVTHA